MARVDNLTHEEMGAILIVCGMLMMDYGLVPGAALDGTSKEFVREQLGQQLKHHDVTRLDQLAEIDAGQAVDAMNGLESLQS